MMYKQVTQPFDLSFFGKAVEPGVLLDVIPSILPKERLLHYCIKLPNQDDFTLGKAEDLFGYLDYVEDAPYGYGVDPYTRYIYVTYDYGWVEPGECLRTEGWHVDGLQGDEVQPKCAGDFTTFWSNTLPTEYVVQDFDVENLDLSKHNIFDALGKQVNSEIKTMTCTDTWLLSPYILHRSPKAQELTWREFVRVSFSHIPITSVKMTVNEDLEYDYVIHTTTGEIPEYLT